MSEELTSSTTGSPEPGPATASPEQAQQSGNPEKSHDALPPISHEQARGLMDRLGIPGKLRAEASGEVATEQPTETQEEPTQPEETPLPSDEPAGEDAEPKGDAEPHEGEPEEGDEEPEGSEEEGQQQEQDPKLAKLKRKNYSLRKRAQSAESKAYEWQERAEKAEQQLGQGPVVMPTTQNPLAHINDLASLEMELGRYVQLQEQAEDNPEGWIADEGTPEERVVTAEQSKYLRRWAKGVIEKDGARKRVELEKVRPAARANAEKIMPGMFKRGSDDFQAAAKLHRDFPWLAADPLRDELTAVMLRGFKEIANASNGSQLPAKILSAQRNKENGAAKAATPPGRPSALPNGNKPMTAVLAGVAKSGDVKSLQAGLKALRGAQGTSGRDLATV